MYKIFQIIKYNHSFSDTTKHGIKILSGQCLLSVGLLRVAVPSYEK